MKSPKSYLILSLLVVYLAIESFATTLSQEETFNTSNERSRDAEHLRGTTSLRRGASRFLSQKVTCDKNPRMCLANGSPGRDCCNGTCVDLDADDHNCGQCGKKCKFSEICCGGKAVNPSWDQAHCGGCNRKCQHKTQCAYGMCSYA